MEITQAEKEVLSLLNDEFLTIKKIAIRRKCSRQAVYKIINSLKKKGLINQKVDKVDRGGVDTQPSNQIRLHNQQWNIRILYFDERYKNYIKNNNKIMIDGNTIMLYRDVIEIYMNKEFYGNDANDSFKQSIEYLNRLCSIIENDLKIILIKDRVQNFKIVRQHFSEINNEIAREYEEKGEKFKVIANDGKLWALIDNSFNLREIEFIHPTTSKQDTEKVIKHLNDWRNNNPPTISEIMTLIREISEQNKEIAIGLNALLKILNLNNSEDINQEKEKYINNKVEYIG